MMGRSHQNEEAYFAQLLGDNATDPEDEADVEPQDIHIDDEDSGNSFDNHLPPHLLPVHCEIFPAQFLLPRSFHAPQDLMSEETDEEELMAELQEDYSQDKQDQQLSERALKIIYKSII